MPQKDTKTQFHSVLAQCRKLFVDKMKDYGPAWRILRTPSITDQIFIKVKRIRTLQTTSEQLVDEGIEPEFIGIVNYAAMGIIQLQLGVVDQPDLTAEEATALYDKVTNEAYELMMRKNHDYDEAWRDMRVSSITDLIMSKVLRTKSIEDHGGKTLVKRNSISMPWISIVVALASAVGIYFLPAYHFWFLAILLLNLLASLIFSRKYDTAPLTVCRLLVGALFIFSSFTKGVDPLGTKYKMLDYLAVYGMTWLNDFALVLAMVMILAEFIVGICLITKVCPRLAVLGATCVSVPSPT